MRNSTQEDDEEEEEEEAKTLIWECCVFSYSSREKVYCQRRNSEIIFLTRCFLFGNPCHQRHFFSGENYTHTHGKGSRGEHRYIGRNCNWRRTEEAEVFFLCCLSVCQSQIDHATFWSCKSDWLGLLTSSCDCGNHWWGWCHCLQCKETSNSLRTSSSSSAPSADCCLPNNYFGCHLVPTPHKEQEARLRT